MAVNLDKPQRWKADVAASVEMYNQWFLDFAPVTFRATRITATTLVEASLKATSYLRDIRPETIRNSPGILSMLRMTTCPTLAVDRLIGLSGANGNLVKTMEKDKKLPAKMAIATIDNELDKIGEIIKKMADPDIFVWLERGDEPSKEEIHRSATIVADRLCGSQANPIIRNEQERRQLSKLSAWLKAVGYKEVETGARTDFKKMKPGTFSFRLNVKVFQSGSEKHVNIPIDAVIMPKNAKPNELPLLIEAKSAGDFTNTNKRRKEEAVKMSQLRHNYGDDIRFILLLCGYFDSGYLGYEAAEGIDWIWEHRIEDLAELGLL